MEQMFVPWPFIINKPQNTGPITIHTQALISNRQSAKHFLVLYDNINRTRTKGHAQGDSAPTRLGWIQAHAHIPSIMPHNPKHLLTHSSGWPWEEMQRCRDLVVP